MYCICPGNLTPTARPVPSGARALSRPRLLLCRAAAAPAATELASGQEGPEMIVRLAQPEDTHQIVNLTRELAQVLRSAACGNSV